MRKILFRADAGVEIGYGHFIRSLALANILKDYFDCYFATVNPTEYQLKQISEVCAYLPLPADGTHFEYFLSLLKGDEIVVLDNYFFTTDYQRAIKNKKCALVCIDDMHDKHYLADIVINSTTSSYSKFSIENYTQLCIGYTWALLRPPFYKKNNLERKKSDKLQNIVICFGASDYYDLTSQFIQYLLKEKDIKYIKAIIGDKYPQSQIIQSPRVGYYQNISAEEMVRLFDDSDLAILSASTVCLEALACHIPIAAGYYVDNQVEAYNEYVKHEMIFPLGNLKNYDFTISFTEKIKSDAWVTDRTEDYSHIPYKYMLLFCNLFNFKNYRIKDLSFIDYRNINKKQSIQIWEARNEKKVRLYMENPEYISWDTHLEFLSKLSHSYRKIYWAIYQGVELIGSVNIEFDNSMLCVERGIFVTTKCMNHSYGTMIEKSLETILSNLNVREIKAKVLKENSRSLHFHLKNGYVMEATNEKYVFLIKYLQNGGSINCGRTFCQSL